MRDETHPDSLFSKIPRLDVPVFFLSGEKDMNTPAQLVREYYEGLDARRGKELFVFEDAAHTPYLSQNDAFCDVMLDIRHAQE
jgi:pimeloyl-ACP methyl ester carboxylesterase